MKVVPESKSSLKPSRSEKYVSLPSTINIERSDILTITHINTSKREELIEFVNNLDGCEKKLKVFDKSIEIILENQEDFYRLETKLQ
jgi:mevalonate kinase